MLSHSSMFWILLLKRPKRSFEWHQCEFLCYINSGWEIFKSAVVRNLQICEFLTSTRKVPFVTGSSVDLSPQRWTVIRSGIIWRVQICFRHRCQNPSNHDQRVTEVGPFAHSNWLALSWGHLSSTSFYNSYKPMSMRTYISLTVPVTKLIRRKWCTSLKKIRKTQKVKEKKNKKKT